MSQALFITESYCLLFERGHGNSVMPRFLIKVYCYYSNDVPNYSFAKKPAQVSSQIILYLEP